MKQVIVNVLKGGFVVQSTDGERYASPGVVVTSLDGVFAEVRAAIEQADSIAVEAPTLKQ